MATPTDFYGILGVQRTASDEEIRSAFRTLAFQWHPDRNPGSAEAQTKFVQIANAYEVLKDPARRRDYDLSLRQPPPSACPPAQAASVRPSPPNPASSPFIASPEFAALRTRYPGRDDAVLFALWLYAQTTGEALPGTPGARASTWDKVYPDDPERALVAKVATRVVLGVIDDLFTQKPNASRTRPAGASRRLAKRLPKARAKRAR